MVSNVVVLYSAQYSVQQSSVIVSRMPSKEPDYLQCTKYHVVFDWFDLLCFIRRPPAVKERVGLFSRQYGSVDVCQQPPRSSRSKQRRRSSLAHLAELLKELGAAKGGGGRKGGAGGGGESGATDQPDVWGEVSASAGMVAAARRGTVGDIGLASGGRGGAKSKAGSF